jgi:2-oxoglutarate dehydrogenase E2 component (dihydrolipoamide succinyltransferase)
MTDLVVPTLGESITEAVIGKWLVKVGEHVGADEPVVDLETDKITIQLPSPAAGALTEQKYAVGDTVQVGDIVGMIDPSVEGTAPAAAESKAETGKATEDSSPAATPQSLPERDDAGRVLSPAQRRLIREGKAPAPVVAAPAVPVVHPPQKESFEEVVPMSPLRRRIAERLVQAQQSSASLTTFNEVDMSGIIEMRKIYKEDFLAKHGVKLGFMSFAVKASVEALKLFPGVNAEVRDTAIVYKKRYDLGIAVGTDRGLVVPVLRSCDSLGFADIEQGIVDLATKARSNKLVLDDLLNGTFTITNGGIYGSMMSTPLLNFPQTGILGLHNIVKRPVVVGTEMSVRPMMYIALTYDHRVVDGKEAVQFLVAVKERMENPQRLLFGV